MCGIGGYALLAPARATEWLEGDLLPALRRRGPDDEGACLASRADGTVRHLRTAGTVAGLAGLVPVGSEEAVAPHDVALAATRYAVLDRTDASHQPFASADGSVVGVFNGEIYNHEALRVELAARGVRFRTKGDTEVLVEGYRQWGQDLWPRLNGFWAVTLYDGRDRSLVLSRDRFGIAPLYARWTDRGIFFASLLRPLVALDPGGVWVDPGAVRGFVETELEGFGAATCLPPIRAIPPACALILRPGAARGLHPEAATYWTPPEERSPPGDPPLEVAAARLTELLVDAVELRTRADLPVAFELSGGLDSSSVVAAAAAAGHEVTAYTLKWPGRDEEPFARAMCERWRIDHRVLEPRHLVGPGFRETAREFAAVLERPYHAPNVHTHDGMRRAMKADGIGVALVGSGGDEILGGYGHDFWPSARAEIRADGRSLQALAHGFAFGFCTPRRAVETSWYAMKRLRRRWLRAPGRGRPRPGGARRGPGGGGGGPGGGGREPGDRVGGSETAAHRQRRASATLSFGELRRFHVRVGLLPHYLATDDAHSMAIPLEHRLPFLDHRLVEFALRLPAAYLFRRGWSKFILRKAMEPYLPPAIAWRREKMGFPLRLDRFLVEHRETLEPALLRAARAGLVDGADAPSPGAPDAAAAALYAGMLQDDPQRLWRAGSAGLWLDVATGDWGVPEPFGRDGPPGPPGGPERPRLSR